MLKLNERSPNSRCRPALLAIGLWHGPTYLKTRQPIQWLIIEINCQGRRYPIFNPGIRKPDTVRCLVWMDE